MYLYLHTNIHEWISNNNDDEDDNDGYDHKLFQLKLEDLHKNVPVAMYLPFKLVQSGSFLCLIFIFIYMYCHTLEQRKDNYTKVKEKADTKMYNILQYFGVQFYTCMYI